MNAFKKFLLDDSGAAAVEYGLLVASIAAVIVFTVATLGTSLETAFCKVLQAIDKNAECGAPAA